VGENIHLEIDEIIRVIHSKKMKDIGLYGKIKVE